MDAEYASLCKTFYDMNKRHSYCSKSINDASLMPLAMKLLSSSITKPVGGTHGASNRKRVHFDNDDVDMKGEINKAITMLEFQKNLDMKETNSLSMQGMKAVQPQHVPHKTLDSFLENEPNGDVREIPRA